MTSIITAIILGALISIATIALTVFLGIWVYRDAKYKGMNGILWTAVALLVPGYVGLIIYLVVRSDNHNVICSNCSKAVSGRDQFCSNCGMELVPETDPAVGSEFRKSQKKVLIGFFSSLGSIVILTIFMITALVTGMISFVGQVVEWASGFDAVEWVDTLEETLGDIDVLFDEAAWRLSIDGDSVEVTDREGNELISIDGSNETVDVDMHYLRELLDEYGVDYDRDMSEDELEQLLEEQIDKQIKEEMQTGQSVSK